MLQEQNIKFKSVLARFKQRYITRSEDVVLLKVLTAPADTPRVALIGGPPGVGKTYFAETLAWALNARFEKLVIHSWITHEEMFEGVNLKAFAKNAPRGESAYYKGPLWRACEASLEGPTVLLIDEIDKAYERTEYLLLEFLDVLTITLPNGKVVKGNPKNLIVIMTTNNTRELHDATMRRCFKYDMDYLPADEERKIIFASLPRDLRYTKSGTEYLPYEMIAEKIYQAVIYSRSLGNVVSIKEIRQFCKEIAFITDVDELTALMAGRLGRGDKQTYINHAQRLYDEIMYKLQQDMSNDGQGSGQDEYDEYKEHDEYEEEYEED